MIFASNDGVSFVPQGLLVFLLLALLALLGFLLAFSGPLAWRLFKRKVRQKRARLSLEKKIEVLESELRFLSGKVQEHQESLNQLFLSRGMRK